VFSWQACAGQQAKTPITHTLTIYADQSGLVGHVFVELSDGRNDLFYGFYPPSNWEDTIGKLATSVLRIGGEIRDDKHHEWDVKSQQYVLSRENFNNAIRGIEEARTQGEKWWYTHHCGDFAEGVATVAGLDIHPPWTLLGRDRPFLFGEYLMAHGGHRNGEVSVKEDSTYLINVAQETLRTASIERSFWARQEQIRNPEIKVEVEELKEIRAVNWGYFKALIHYACADPEGLQSEVSSFDPHGVVFSYQVIAGLYAGEQQSMSACDRQLIDSILAAQRPIDYHWLNKQVIDYRRKVEAAARKEAAREEREREAKAERESAREDYERSSARASSQSQSSSNSPHLGAAYNQAVGIAGGNSSIFDSP
jgi:hypothetical protein